MGPVWSYAGSVDAYIAYSDVSVVGSLYYAGMAADYKGYGTGSSTAPDDSCDAVGYAG